MTSSFIPRSRDEAMACFHTCLDSVASALKSTELVYIRCVSKENFAVTVKGFTFVSLICREIHISYMESMDERGRALVPVFVVNLPTDELFAGVRSAVVIRISSSCDITVSSQDSVIFLGLLTETCDLRSCFCVLTTRHCGGVRSFLKQYFKSARRHHKIMAQFMTLLLVPFLQCLDPSDLIGDGLTRSLLRSFELIPAPALST